MFTQENLLLSKVMLHLRRTRPMLDSQKPYYNRVERAQGRNYVEVWFLTSGCRWDATGGCTMCNYGHGPKSTDDEIVDAVYQGLSAINVEVNELVVSPSGSMLDPLEVPVNARRRIYKHVNGFPTPKFVFETRPETVTHETVKEYVKHVKNKKLGVEMGLESSNAWVQRFCINKGNIPDEFVKAARILKDHNICVYANIAIGTPFLNPMEAIKDAVNSVRWAFSHGADICVLFPLHVKPYTLSAWLYGENLYRNPSLWSLVEVLHQLEAELIEKTEISWHRNYYDEPSKVISSPTTCQKCQKDVLNLLDEYRNSRSPWVVEKLLAIQCDCKNTWKNEIERVSTKALPERVFRIYEELACRFVSVDWWNSYSSSFKKELESTFEFY